jgi:hypothetical protein
MSGEQKAKFKVTQIADYIVTGVTDNRGTKIVFLIQSHYFFFLRKFILNLSYRFNRKKIFIISRYHEDLAFSPSNVAFCVKRPESGEL